MVTGYKSGYTLICPVFGADEVQPMTFAEKLRELRAEASLSEARLSKASGIPLGTIHSYTMGLRKPSLSAAVKIARALGVTCEAFADCEDIGGEEEEEKPRKSKARRRPREE